MEALVLDDNLVVRAANGGQEVWRSQDGSPADFYDPETIAWSPDGRHIALQRVRPGYARMVTRVLAAPPGKVQPEVVQQLYPSPAMPWIRKSPSCSGCRTASGRHRPEPVHGRLYPVRPRMADSQSFAFNDLKRGFGETKIIAVDAEPAGRTPP